MKEDNHSSAKLVLEIVAIVISIIALVQTILTARQSNAIAELTAKPSIILLDVEPGYSNGNSCLYRIRLANIGGARTDLIKYSVYMVIADSKYEEAAFSTGSATYFGPDVETYGDITLQSSAWRTQPADFFDNKMDGTVLLTPIVEGMELPIPLESHSNGEVYINVKLTFKDYKIVGGYAWLDKQLYPTVNSNNKNIKTIPVKMEFVLHFPGAEDVDIAPQRCLEILPN